MLALLASPGCLVCSLHPVYEPDTIVFDEALVGAWENKESEITVVVSRAEWRSYDIDYVDRTGKTRYHGHLTTVGDVRLLNVVLHDGLEQPPFMIAANGFMQIEVQSNAIRVREPDYEAVLDRVGRGKLGIDAATDLEQNVVITASTARLRSWLAAALKDEALWAEWKTLSRSSR